VKYTVSPSQKRKPPPITVETLRQRREEVEARLRALEPARREIEGLLEERRRLDSLIGPEA
jgi:hypothetical protein